MAGFRDDDKQFFPLQNIGDVVDLFRRQVEKEAEPNLTLLSIVLGSIENALTVSRSIPSPEESSTNLEPIFPLIELDTVEALYQKFVTQIRSSVDLSNYDSKFANRELVKRVSDVVWGALTRSYYKDKAHLQSLYSYLTGNKLDCFGVSLAVVAAFQVLGFHDVHLALSEDHAWVVFNQDGCETAEVTWHGKGNEDKRGQPINAGVSHKAWLYVHGHPVICTRHMEVAAIVSSINQAITATIDSVEMASVQQALLWLLHDNGHIDKYPLAIGNLGDLEEIYPSPGRPTSLDLLHRAIEATKRYYDNRHVYPYTYLAGYHYRKGQYKKAIQNWTNAANVIRNYNYSRQDEEIYKEFLEISHEFIPTIVKVCSEHSGGKIRRVSSDGELPLLQDPEVYAMLLQLYDGICEWEEDSGTPVLHVVWAKYLCFCLAKFEPWVRQHVLVEGDGDEDEDEDDKEEVHEGRTTSMDVGDNECIDRRKKKPGKNSPNKGSSESSAVNNNSESTDEKTPGAPQPVNGTNEEEQIKSAIQELQSKIGVTSQNEAPNPNIAALAQACGESILNPEYLISGGEPFATQRSASPSNTTSIDTRVDVNEFLSSKSNGSPFPGMTMDSLLKADSPSDMMLCKDKTPPQNGTTQTEHDKTDENENVDRLHERIDHPQMKLQSAKMRGMKDLLTAAKLNSSAIKLQLTAQSQVSLKHSKVNSEYESRLPRKRTRRERD